jgi:stage V sporulation protein G
MRVTDIKIKLAQGDDKLLAFASATFDDCFVVRDIKVIRGVNGLFVAMPSRKMTDRCAACGAKNMLQARYCGHCGQQQPERRLATDARGRAKYHADIAHPINSRYRKELQDAILNGYQAELARSRQPGYVPPNLEESDEVMEEELTQGNSAHKAAANGSGGPSQAAPAANTGKAPKANESGLGIFA